MLDSQDLSATPGAKSPLIKCPPLYITNFVAPIFALHISGTSSRFRTIKDSCVDGRGESAGPTSHQQAECRSARPGASQYPTTRRSPAARSHQPATCKTPAKKWPAKPSRAKPRNIQEGAGTRKRRGRLSHGDLSPAFQVIDRTGPNQTGPVRTEPNRTEPDRTEPNPNRTEPD